MPYFKPNIDADGIHIPTYEDILDYLIGEYKGIFGQDAYLGTETQDYQLLSVFARCMDDYAALIVDNYNSRNPNYAVGNALDLLLPLIGMSRLPATKSFVTLTLGGTPGTVIAAGKEAIDDEGYIWALDEAVTLDGNGTGSGVAHCTTAGAIAAPIGTIRVVYSTVVGWNTVTNAAEATVGRNVETDSEVRLRIVQVNNAKGITMASAIIGALVNIDYVKHVRMLQNDTGTTDANGIPGHSIACVVSDGDEDEIAKTIFEKKAPGIGTYGTTTKTVMDSYGNSHSVSYSKTTNIATSIQITMTKLDGFHEDDVKAYIKSAIADYFSKLEIGQSLIVSQLWGVCYTAVPELASTFYITGIKATSTAYGEKTTVMDVDWDELIAVSESNITFVINTP